MDKVLTIVVNVLLILLVMVSKFKEYCLVVLLEESNNQDLRLLLKENKNCINFYKDYHSCKKDMNRQQIKYIRSKIVTKVKNKLSQISTPPSSNTLNTSKTNISIFYKKNLSEIHKSAKYNPHK